MYTYQDYEDYVAQGRQLEFLLTAIKDHQSSDIYKLAVDADRYDRQRNTTINQYVKTILQLSGEPLVDFTASNAKIASNFFHRLNTQRATYSLGNGLTFSRIEKRVQADGTEKSVDTTKLALGSNFDTDFYFWAYTALIHGLAFGFWNVTRLHIFPVTEFVPLWDENDGSLRAGIRFWQIDVKKPLTVVLYEEDGYTEYRTKKDDPSTLLEIAPKRAYAYTVVQAPADAAEEIVGETNYGSLPIIPFWGSKLHQSTLVGMKQGIDAYDLVRSGFANDLQDVSQIYWIIENCGGMKPIDLMRVRDRLKIFHVANADTDDGGRITPYTQEVPYQARQTFLDGIRAGIYEDFGGLDVHTVAAGATNDHIDAAYQPMDENADDFEYQCIEAIQQVLKLLGIEDTPVFKRNRISNQREQVEMVVMEAGLGVLDDETILTKLPNISPDEIAGILARVDAGQKARSEEDPDPDPDKPDEEEEVIV